MNEVVCEAKTVEEAIEKGLEQLDASRDQVEVEVLEEGKSGLLGLMSKAARVRLTLKEDKAPAQKPERKPERQAPVAQPPSPSPSEEERREEKAVEQAAYEPPENTEPIQSQPPEEPSVERAVKIAKDIIAHMGLEGEVTGSVQGEEMVLDITGTGGVLIGRRGQTLSSLQYLVNRIYNQDKDVWDRISVDVEEYRSRRDSEMLEMAERLYKKVKNSGKSVTIKNLSASDRRIVHMTLRERPEVETRSYGSGHLRKLVIAPKGSGEGRGERDRGRDRDRGRGRDRSRDDNRSKGRRGGKREDSSSGTDKRLKMFSMRFESTEQQDEERDQD